MINQVFIESAKTIRIEFLDLNNKLHGYEQDVRNLANFLFQKVNELSKYNEEVVLKLKNKEELLKATQHIVKEIEDIEVEEKKLHKKVEKINSRLEKLRVDEENLYNSIKQKYPDLSDEEIVKEIHSHLEK